jgi:hypothetical protein
MIPTYVVIVKFSSLINHMQLVVVQEVCVCPTNPVWWHLLGFEGIVDYVDFLFHDI